MSEVRPFTINDWECYSGALSFEEGTLPHIRELNGADALVDLGGLAVVFEDGTEYDISLGVLTPTMCKAVLAGLPDDITKAFCEDELEMQCLLGHS